MKPKFTLLGGQDRAAFSCGKPDLDNYLKTQASQDMRRQLAACHVLIDQDHPSQIVGYYTLSTADVAFTDLPHEMRKKAGRYKAVPAILLGRLAVDVTFQGQGIGKVLLVDALLRTLELSAQVGIMLFIVDALEESVVMFYEKYDFKRFDTHPMRLYVSISKVRDMFAKPQGQ